MFALTGAFFPLVPVGTAPALSSLQLGTWNKCSGDIHLISAMISGRKVVKYLGFHLGSEGTSRHDDLCEHRCVLLSLLLLLPLLFFLLWTSLDCRIQVGSHLSVLCARAL